MEINIKSLMKHIRQSNIFKQEIPMEAISGWPALQRKGKNVYITVPYYMLDRQGKGKTLIFPPLAIVTMECASGKIVEYCNTLYKGIAEDAGEAVGVFPHDAISRFTVKEYKDLKNQIFDLYDELLRSLLSNTGLSTEIEGKFSENLKILIEPSLRPFYLKIAPKFFEYFLK